MLAKYIFPAMGLPLSTPAVFRFFVKSFMVGDDVEEEFSVGHPME
ncbi:hypothetical protein [Methanosarcina sp. 2.H.A.1B.4]|nr:hypothetical protein [Methanosarcina sp. 2.H.A.1B.4]